MIASKMYLHQTLPKSYPFRERALKKDGLTVGKKQEYLSLGGTEAWSSKSSVITLICQLNGQWTIVNESGTLFRDN